MLKRYQQLNLIFDKFGKYDVSLLWGMETEFYEWGKY